MLFGKHISHDMVLHSWRLVIEKFIVSWGHIIDIKLRTNCDQIFRTLCTLAQRTVWCVYQRSTVAGYTAEWHVRMPWIHTADGMNWKSSALQRQTMTLCRTTGSRALRSALYLQTLVSASPSDRKPDHSVLIMPCTEISSDGVLPSQSLFELKNIWEKLYEEAQQSRFPLISCSSED